MLGELFVSKKVTEANTNILFHWPSGLWGIYKCNLNGHGKMPEDNHTDKYFTVGSLLSLQLKDWEFI